MREVCSKANQLKDTKCSKNPKCDLTCCHLGSHTPGLKSQTATWVSQKESARKQKAVRAGLTIPHGKVHFGPHKIHSLVWLGRLASVGTFQELFSQAQEQKEEGGKSPTDIRSIWLKATLGR